MARFHFISGLPRSGSTLLQNILSQNPRFYCSPTSGLFDLLYNARDVELVALFSPEHGIAGKFDHDGIKNARDEVVTVTTASRRWSVTPAPTSPEPSSW